MRRYQCPTGSVHQILGATTREKRHDLVGWVALAAWAWMFLGGGWCATHACGQTPDTMVAALNVQASKETEWSSRVLLANLPTGQAAAAGFTAQITLSDAPEPGYFPLTVRVQSTSSFTRHRKLLLRMVPLSEGHSPRQNLFTIDIPIEIQQGTASQVVNRYVPRWSVGNAYRVQFFEDNRPLDEYGTELGKLNLKGLGIPANDFFREGQGRWLYVQGHGDDVAPDERDIASAVSGISLMAVPERTSDPQFWEQFAAEGFYRYASVSQCPTDWRGYQSIDAVIGTAETFRKWRQMNRRGFDALRQWMMCGGTVVVTDLADANRVCELFFVAYSQTKEVTENYDRFVGRAEVVYQNELETMQRAKAFVMEASQAASTFPVLDLYEVPGWRFTGDAVSNAYLSRLMPTPTMLAERLDRDLRQWELREDWDEAQWRDALSIVPVVAGQLIGLGQAKTSQTPRLVQWHFVRDFIGFRKSAMLRRGVDPILGDARVRRWLIPGVAEPPVYTFMGLLGLFVILVGPVAYRKTAQQGRTHLMFIIAPLLALLTTLAMFGYGIMADGFGTSARIRQLTWVDGRSGDAGERVRATYFAGIRPSAGIRFPPDAEVFQHRDPLGLSWEAMHNKSSGDPGNVVIDESGQRLNSSFLPSRQQRQFVIHRPQAQVGTLSLRHAGEQPVLVSTLSMTLREVIVRDKDGEYWAVDQIASDPSGVVCEPLTATQASRRLGDLYLDYRPIDLQVDGRDRYRQSNRYQQETVDLISIGLRRIGLTGTTMLLDGVFEQRLQQWLQTEGMLPTSSFFSLADVSPEVISVADAQLIESVHYVYGTLAP